MARIHCEDCRFWERMQKVESEVWSGQCRRHAPQGSRISPHGVRAIWISTMFDDWCGEGEARGDWK